MSILVDKNTRVMVQGLTGTQASFHTKLSIDGGTNVVAGVNPNKAGETCLDLPVFASVKEAKKAANPNATVLFVPPTAVKSAMQETIEAEIPLAVCITAGVPIHDMLEIKYMLKGSKTQMIGPNTPGIHLLL